MTESKKEHIKYRVIAHIVALRINKKISFETKVIWKRNVNKAETSTVTHSDCVSQFNQDLSLELNLLYDPKNSRFEPKMTEFGVVVIYHGKVKSGGFVRYDAAQIINENYEGQTVRLQLQQCPDPEAYLDLVLSYQSSGEASKSLFSELSMLNGSTFQNDLSQIDFRDDRSEASEENCITLPKTESTEAPFKEKELNKINNILDKFENLSRRVSASKVSHPEEQSSKNQSLQISTIPSQYEQKLRLRVNELEQKLIQKQGQIDDYQLKIEHQERQIQEMQMKMELMLQQREEEKMKAREVEVAMTENEGKFKVLYERTLGELEEMKGMISDGNFSRQSMGFNKFLEEVNEVDEIPQFERSDKEVDSESYEQLRRENVQLQTKLASASHNIAQLFNAAYDFGGAKLLDYLQASIGLVEA